MVNFYGTLTITPGTRMRRNVAARLTSKILIVDVCFACQGLETDKQNGTNIWRHRKGPAHRHTVSTTEKLRANSGRLRVNVGFRERGGRYSTLRPD